MTDTNWSPYQLAIFDEAATSTNLIIDAVAGSGKTTTAVELAKRIGVRNVAFLAFNKAIAEELKLRRGITTAATFHSAGLRMLKTDSRFNSARVVFSKTRDALRSIIPAAMQKLYSRPAATLISFYKQMALTEDEVTFNATRDILAHHDIDMDRTVDVYQLHKFAVAGFARTVELCSESIDFDDMLYAPFRFSIPFTLAPTIIVDEAQDTNILQRRLLHSSGARIIAVGDPYQSIYGFRGAASDALHAIAEEFACKTLPLSVCYRCGTTILDEARKIVPHIQAAAGAEPGVVEYAVSDWDTVNAVICRLNAPLLRAFFNLIRAGRKACILGRNLGDQLVAVLEKESAGINSFEQLRTRLSAWHKQAMADLEKEERSTDTQEDKFSCLCELVDGVEATGGTSPTDVIKRAATLFADEESPGVITLSSIHKAKGREWDHVVFLAPELIPMRSAKQDWQLRQEENLRYVAITRAARRLSYLSPSKDA